MKGVSSMNPEDKKKIRELHQTDKTDNLNKIDFIRQEDKQNKHSKGNTKKTLFEKTQHAKTQYKNAQAAKKIGRSEKKYER